MISTELSAGHSTGLDSTDAIPDGGDDGRQEDQQQVHDDGSHQQGRLPRTLIRIIIIRFRIIFILSINESTLNLFAYT